MAKSQQQKKQNKKDTLKKGPKAKNHNLFKLETYSKTPKFNFHILYRYINWF